MVLLFRLLNLLQSHMLTEWGINEDGKTYGHWVDGVVTFADALLDKLIKSATISHVALIFNSPKSLFVISLFSK